MSVLEVLREAMDVSEGAPTGQAAPLSCGSKRASWSEASCGRRVRHRRQALASRGALLRSLCIPERCASLRYAPVTSARLLVASRKSSSALLGCVGAIAGSCAC